MSLATDILNKHLVKPSAPRQYQAGDGEYYAQGYAWRKQSGRHTGRDGLLTWKIPLAQIQTMIRQQIIDGSRDPIVWPWVADDMQMRVRQVARMHARAKREGWVIATRQMSKGLQITYQGERKRRQRRRAAK